MAQSDLIKADKLELSTSYYEALPHPEVLSPCLRVEDCG
jgi:hypothetical protein